MSSIGFDENSGLCSKIKIKIENNIKKKRFIKNFDLKFVIDQRIHK